MSLAQRIIEKIMSVSDLKARIEEIDWKGLEDHLSKMFGTKVTGKPDVKVLVWLQSTGEVAIWQRRQEFSLPL